MSRLAFSNNGKYTDFSKGYALYVRRCRKSIPVKQAIYNRIIREYCKYLSCKLEDEGMVDFPKRAGTLFTALFSRKPQYRGKKFVGYGKIDWNTGNYDGSNTAFGVVYLPNRTQSQCMRCYGFVANRRLFIRLKNAYTNQTCNWKPLMFNEKMI